MLAGGLAGESFRETLNTFDQGVERWIQTCLQYANIYTFEHSNIWYSNVNICNAGIIYFILKVFIKSNFILQTAKLKRFAARS